MRMQPATEGFTELHIRGKLLRAEADFEDPDAVAEGKVLQLLEIQDGTRPKRRDWAIGHITFDLIDLVTAKVVCLYLFTDFTGYPVILGLREVTHPEEGETVRYRRVGIGSLRQGLRQKFKDDVEMILI